MPLRKSPTLTPALLAACGSNAKKSTGPRTPEGKSRVSLNALKHGGYAVELRKRILRTYGPESDAQYRWFRSEIARTFHGGGPAAQRLAERLAAYAWCQARLAERVQAKHESALLSTRQGAPQGVLLRIRIEDRQNGIGLTFWLQRRKYWTRAKLLDLLSAEDPSGIMAAAGKLEERWRRQKVSVRPLLIRQLGPAPAPAD